MTEEATPGRSSSIGSLWDAFAQEPTEERRNQLALHYAPLVKYVVGRLASGLPAHVDHADLASDGMLGLIDAIQRFDPGRGLQFPTFAVPRIRGAILDGLRALDWVPRAVRERFREAERLRDHLTAELGRVPSAAEIADRLGITVAELIEIYSRTSLTSIPGLDAVGMAGLTEGSAGDPLKDPHEARALRRAVRTLPERDQVVLALYYFENFTLTEIGSVLGVSESRVSQLHSRATLTLRERLATTSD